MQQGWILLSITMPIGFYSVYCQEVAAKYTKNLTHGLDELQGDYIQSFSSIKNTDEVGGPLVPTFTINKMM